MNLQNKKHLTSYQQILNRHVVEILQSVVNKSSNLQDFIELKSEEIRDIQDWDQDLHYDLEDLASKAATITQLAAELIEYGSFQDE
tara:strand:- start:57 stop:314 length:258 start_codon:yes stop_codon:yes gene_type:complete